MSDAIHELVLAAGNEVGTLVDNSATFEALFPVLQQGSASQRFCVTDDAHKAELDDIDGKESIVGYYIAHRFNFVAYPSKLKTDEENKLVGEQDKPCYGGAVPFIGPDSTLVKNAAAAVQFTKSSDRNKFDFATTKAGLPRVSLELLAYVPKVNRVVVLRSYNHYNGIYKGGKALECLDALKGDDGRIKQSPIKFQGMEETGFGGSPLIWVKAAYDASSLKKCQEALDDFLANQYKDLLPDLNKWIKCEDNPITDTVRGYLANAVALNPPKR